MLGTDTTALLVLPCTMMRSPRCSITRFTARANFTRSCSYATGFTIKSRASTSYPSRANCAMLVTNISTTSASFSRSSRAASSPFMPGISISMKTTSKSALYFSRKSTGSAKCFISVVSPSSFAAFSAYALSARASLSSSSTTAIRIIFAPPAD